MIFPDTLFATEIYNTTVANDLIRTFNFLLEGCLSNQIATQAIIMLRYYDDGI
jgi:hypothetical protein